jgi:hypothetical protein
MKMKKVMTWSAVAMACASVVLTTGGCKKPAAEKEDGAVTGSASGITTTAAVAYPCKDDTNKALVDGKLSKCLLTKDFTVDGYTCEGGKVFELLPSGKLKGCYLATAKVVDGYSCKDGLSLYDNGKLRRCKLTAPRNAGPGTEVRAGDWVSFYPDGSIRRLESGANKIQGLPCKGYLNFFHENGKLKKCELSEDATVEGKRISAKSDAGYVYVCFDDKGKRVADCGVLTGMTMD